MMHRILSVFLLWSLISCKGFEARAQHSFSFNNGPLMARFQDSLLMLGRQTFDAPSNTERFASNAAFIRTLVDALKTPYSYQYGFDSLKHVSILKSPDNRFRVFTWYVPQDDGTYRFFGSIQMATADGKLKLYPLIDQTAQLKDPDAVTGNTQWFGARYYEILPLVQAGKPASYVLIGWKGNDSKTSKKVIDILSFEKDGAVFGKAVFDGPKDAKPRNRIIFEYNRRNSMTLTADRTANMIVFDHLAPMSPEMEGNFEYYASDLSFDAYKILNGRLKLLENIELKNEPNVMDEFYADPTDKSVKPVRKL